ncbi:GguC protein [Aureimonas fodinaquatilis]|uniref:GguC protein n=1 Tax=Aureimonas fodinaquatilis TaxID=2565783 RepID=A0A5B0DSM7_9HYPH|nr:AraD1 family protein [Aureimonas fodinaquatilis]KAA0969466.1 GguC protein [Aureimonas fodinaquatilis]
MLLSQCLFDDGTVQVVVRDGPEAYALKQRMSLHAFVLDCIDKGISLRQAVGVIGLGDAVDLATAAAEGRVLSPISHEDPAHLHLTGTGLTHLGSAATRDAMHSAATDEATTDSMRMFNMGRENGKPAHLPGAQPEWFYKGNGSAVAAPGKPLEMPAFAEDGGEEPEIAGIYVIGRDGTPFRVGFALANEFSDHVVERGNYLWLAHSKLRMASFGPEILVGELPVSIEGTSRIRRGEDVVWEKPFLSGEANMSHSLANLEHHHFKYALFRQPGDVHVHMFGTATLSFADGVRTKEGDVFEIEAPGFGLPLRNPLSRAVDQGVATVRAL